MKHHTLARVAERVYWLGRYLERIESTARLVTVNTDLIIDLPPRTSQGWAPLVDIVGAEDLFGALYSEANEHSVVRFLASDLRNPGSVVQSALSARETARTIRDLMPRLAFEIINDLARYATEKVVRQMSRSRRADALGGVAVRVQQLEGFLSANMLHGDPWSFLRLGNHLERADMTTRIIDVRARSSSLEEDDTEAFESVRWRSVLRALYAMQSYQTISAGVTERGLVLEFLFRDRQLPRSLGRCLHSMRTSLRALPRSEKPLRVCNRAIRELGRVDFEASEFDLHEFVDESQVHLMALHDQINATYFSFKPRLPAAQKRRREG